MSVMDIYHTIRATILRAVVKALDDTGPEQRVAVALHAGQERASVPVHHPFGFNAFAPLDGAVTHVIQNGGDPADLFALPPANPGAARMGGLIEGESIQYDAAGQRVYLRDGKIVEVDATSEMVVKIGGQPVFQVTADGVTVNGRIEMSSDLLVKGNTKINGNTDIDGYMSSNGGSF